MSLLFVDTSGLAKRYLSEVGSSWVRALLAPVAGNVVVVSALAQVEMVSLLARRVRENDLTAADAAALEGTFMLQVAAEYLIIALRDDVLADARILVKAHPLRALDALQLASARVAQARLGEAITVISGDRALLSAAAAEGLLVDDPAAHP